MIFIIFSTTYKATESVTQIEQFNFHLQRKYTMYSQTLFNAAIVDQLDKATGIFGAFRHEPE